MSDNIELESSAPTRVKGVERYTDDEQQLMRVDFAKRLRDAFDGATNAEIARRLKASDATIKYYMDSLRLPVYEMLVEISRVTGVNLHWLMTGTGPRRNVKAVEMFLPEEELQIRELANRSSRSFEEQVRIMTIAAAELSSRVTHLP